MKRVKLFLVVMVSLPISVASAEVVKEAGTAPSSLASGEEGHPADLVALVQLGQQLYLEGKSAIGRPLTAVGAGNTNISGAQASCVSCHRRSGLGGVEGNEAIPPITGKALFGGSEPVMVQMDKRFNQSVFRSSKIYNDKTFATAMRQGQDMSGHKLSSLMPRYDLSAEDLQGLTAYLRTLSVSWSPGVDEKEIHLATVIAPEVSAAQRQAFLDTLNAMVNLHNVNVVSGKRQRIPPIERRLHSRRYWKVAIWEPKGPRSTWAAQFDNWQRQQPVFALLSGLSNAEWDPVQQFCEKNKVACWFPSVDWVPDQADKGHYSLYFSEGVTLEAKVIAKQVLSAEKKPQKIVQLIGQSDLEKAGAEATQQAFAQAGIVVENSEGSLQNKKHLVETFKNLQVDDVVISWLSRDELNALVKAVSAPLGTVYLSSTLMGEALPAWPQAWLDKAWLVQRLELSELRAANLSRFQAWLNYRRLPLVDEKMQSEVFFAVNSFSWMLTSMLNNFYTDYLLDRAESTLSMRETMQVQEEVQAMMMGGGGRRPKAVNTPAGGLPTVANKPVSVDKNLLSKRESTTAYPRISLGNGQRFASKGAYLRKLTNDASYAENAKWIVP